MTGQLTLPTSSPSLSLQQALVVAAIPSHRLLNLREGDPTSLFAWESPNLLRAQSSLRFGVRFYIQKGPSVGDKFRVHAACEQSKDKNRSARKPEGVCGQFSVTSTYQAEHSALSHRS
ncbi:unnamed protein product [Rangifer tarandus platyrhynchus]|uniref:Uncharacterized protein n=2 Tax=Rangifer tarandus platyrhynchus TaxID=3082113 RepID=A0ABN9A0L5_RANTA|nr:unnamed protein product [Rangifer tarandus platyrhynchus]